MVPDMLAIDGILLFLYPYLNDASVPVDPRAQSTAVRWQAIVMAWDRAPKCDLLTVQQMQEATAYYAAHLLGIRDASKVNSTSDNVVRPTYLKREKEGLLEREYATDGLDSTATTGSTPLDEWQRLTDLCAGYTSAGMFTLTTLRV